jgi:hypothetical protein
MSRMAVSSLLRGHNPLAAARCGLVVRHYKSCLGGMKMSIEPPAPRSSQALDGKSPSPRSRSSFRTVRVGASTVVLLGALAVLSGCNDQNSSSATTAGGTGAFELNDSGCAVQEWGTVTATNQSGQVVGTGTLSGEPNNGSGGGNSGMVDGYLQCYANFPLASATSYTFTVATGSLPVQGDTDQTIGPYSAATLNANNWEVDCTDNGNLPTYLDCVLSNDSGSLGG